MTPGCAASNWVLSWLKEAVSEAAASTVTVPVCWVAVLLGPLPVLAPPPHPASRVAAAQTSTIVRFTNCLRGSR
ncbi:hypothetical protein GCM10010174_72130 [Kutzneria viridogrisea]